MVIEQNGDHGTLFMKTRGTTQGGIPFLTLFNGAVHNVVWNWFSITVDDDAVIHVGLVHVVGRSTLVFYVNNSLIGSWDPEWLQGVLNRIIGLFIRIGLMAHVAKSKMMMCQPGNIRSIIVEELVGQISTGKRAT